MQKWEDRLTDARNFWEVAETVNDGVHGKQAASNAILAAIAANDAVCLHVGGLQARGESHIEAAQVLQSVCKGTRWEQDARQRSRQLAEIIRHKNAAQYQGRPLSNPDAAKIMNQVARFIAWAEDVVSSA